MKYACRLLDVIAMSLLLPNWSRHIRDEDSKVLQDFDLARRRCSYGSQTLAWPDG